MVRSWQFIRYGLLGHGSNIACSIGLLAQQKGPFECPGYSVVADFLDMIPGAEGSSDQFEEADDMVSYSSCSSTTLGNGSAVPSVESDDFPKARTPR